ncbi:MAG: single-stranded DNA-binding protein [Epulopiscium sp. Nuni2H_MBin003]|nr:MAG: single-stranded DNA-binding protein [Epulopiscium sp. Nuni2H_MBin003]
MSERVLENNEVQVIGKVITETRFSHKVYGEGFYTFDIEIPRLSDSFDTVPVTVSERLLTGANDILGKIFKISGQFRSYNQYEEGKNRLILTLFVLNIEEVEEKELSKNANTLHLKGFVCKNPVYRTTPFGREITDILLAVNRSYHKSDYIPCITWGRNARYANNLKTGDAIEVWGRIQSRTYQKKLESGEVIQKIAYEVSISKMEITEENNKIEE